MMWRSLAILIAEASPYVERATPTAAPRAFRIWAPGRNDSDDGPTFFTRASAERLMAEQEARGRTYSSDFDHLSLISQRPAEAGRASGYHRLEVRETPDGPELWAVDIEWCTDAKSGLEEQPPRWKYFSPAFKQNNEGEVTSYLNFALCINPKTHDLPALASHTETTTMNKKAMRAFLAKMAAAEGMSDDEKKAYATIAAALGDDPGDKDDDKKEPEAKSEEPSEKKDEPEKKAEDCAPEKKSASEGDASQKLAADLVTANRRIEVLEIDKMLSERPDLPESVRTWCQSETAETVRGFLAKMPKLSTPETKRESKATQGKDAGAPELLEGEERIRMDAAMGIRPKTPQMPKRNDDGTFVLNVVRPSELRAHMASQKGQA